MTNLLDKYPIDSDYVRPQSNVSDVTVTDATPMTDGGQPVTSEVGDGAGEHWKNEESLDYIPRQSPARTTCLWWKDHYGNPVDGWTNEQWQLQMGKSPAYYIEEAEEYQRPVGGNDNKATDRAEVRDCYISQFEVCDTIADHCRQMIASENISAYWNRHYQGLEGASVGFLAVAIVESEKYDLTGDELLELEWFSNPARSILGDDADDVDVFSVVRRAFDRAEAHGWV